MNKKKVSLEDFVGYGLSMDELEEIRGYAIKHANAKDKYKNYSFRRIAERHGLKANTVKGQHYRNRKKTSDVMLELDERVRLLKIKTKNSPSAIFKARNYKVSLSVIGKIYKRVATPPCRPLEDLQVTRKGEIKIDLDDIELIKVFANEYSEVSHHLKELTFEKISERHGATVNTVRCYYYNGFKPTDEWAQIIGGDVEKRRLLIGQKKTCSPSWICGKYDVNLTEMQNIYKQLAALP